MPALNSSTAPILLISLGTSPAIVPEAFLLPEARFRAVHVLTTLATGVQPILEFFAGQAPAVELTISRVDGFTDLNSEADHLQFEEVLCRWVLAVAPDPCQRFFCLSGGFKTMSAAVQKAAAVLGAVEVFHVLAASCCQDPGGKPRPPQQPGEIIAASRAGHLKWIRLGGESGWPQFRSAAAADFPLAEEAAGLGGRRLRAPDLAFRERLRAVVERGHRIAEAWESLASLPFPELAAWPAAGLRWLAQPLEPDSPADRAWVARLPKVELHCHLGGFATSGPLLEQVRQAASHPEELPALQALAAPPGWPLPPQPAGLQAYRQLGDNSGSGLLRDPGCLRRQCELLYAHLLEQRVIYAEIRCSPANYAHASQSPWQVLASIREAFQAAMARAAAGPAAHPPCQVNLLVIGTREAGGDCRSSISRHLALAVTAADHWRRPDECRVVGVDLAGFEDPTTRAHYFREEFTAVHRCGLALTIHAGENDGSEAVWRAVFDLNARRLGHALSLAQSPALLKSVADRGIGVELCPYANFQIKGFRLGPDAPGASGTPPRYPLREFLQAGVRATINTDNPGISAATLGDNLLLAARLCPGLTRLDLLRLQRNALDTAFLDPPSRGRLEAGFSRLLPMP